MVAKDHGIINENISLLFLAAVCGGLTGFFGFPLNGFSKSVDGGSWLRIIVLCGVSWLVAGALYPG
jgi:hypothetical protein